MKRMIRWLIGLLCIIVLGVSLARLTGFDDRIRYWIKNRQVEETAPDMAALEAAESETTGAASSALAETSGTDAGQNGQFAAVWDSLDQLKTQNRDLVGWLTMEGTDIDYPVVQAADNDYYLRRSFDGSYLYTGTLFMDYRCRSDCGGLYSIIYGHNIKNGMMFHCLTDYQKQDYFTAHQNGWYVTPEAAYRLEALALCLTDTDSPLVAAPGEDVAVDTAAITREIAKKAVQTNGDMTLHEEDHLLVLSTCAYDFDGARCILVTRAVRVAERNR